MHQSHQTWANTWQSFLQNHPTLQQPSVQLPKKNIKQSATEIATDEKYWEQIQQLFPQPDQHINLNNGGVCSNATLVENAFCAYYHVLNTSPSYFTWKIMQQGIPIIKEGLATLINAEAKEIALFRNATEALNNAIFGIALQAKDEVVACNQDYIKCVSSWKQRELREGIQVRWVDLHGKESQQEVVAKYIQLFTSKTKVLHLTHVINWNGYILPIEEIILEAKKRNIIVLLDAAHSFGILDLDVQRLDIDYMGTALHKWLSGPIAGGMLFIRKNRIAETWPLASAMIPTSASISKMEEMSIQLLPSQLALGHAILFHMQLTREVKEARLRYLRNQWTSILQQDCKIQFTVSLEEKNCAAIAAFTMNTIDPLELEKLLFEKYAIHVVAFHWPNMSGVRITPNLYTPLRQIHFFAQAMKEISANA
jgi:selenocysteine lyase/cysteine desulfurase